MLSVQNMSVSFGERYLFKDINFLINKNDKIGLVGRNGAGKSTLLKIIAKLYTPDKGEVVCSSNITIGYLAQDLNVQSDKTVFDEAHSAFEEFNILQKQIDKINKELEVRTDYESDSYTKLITSLGDLTHEMYELEEGSIDGKIERVLRGLGFKKEDFRRPVVEFSGGWKMRVELAKLLLSNADVLLLDEPTNHLDIESIIWFEEFLMQYKGAVVLISHDKRFLDKLTNRTIEISLGKMFDYKANYSQYLNMREERKTLQAAAYKNQQKSIEETQQFIEKFRAKASKAKQVQSRVKQLNKLELIELEEEEVSVGFYFPPAPHSGKINIKAENVKKTYGKHVVFDNVNLELERGKKVAFVGKNGEGKSTLVNSILNKINFDGNIILGHEVKLAFYAQNQADVLDGDKTILQTIEDIATGDVRSRVRGLLGSFLFTGDDVEKKVKVLSGGERARVALCKLLLKPVNVLILDEPTNHLDIASKQVLKNALLRYNGALILVSHDRDFLSGLTTETYEFCDKKVIHHLKDINEFLMYKDTPNTKDINKKTENKTENKNGKNEETQQILSNKAIKKLRKMRKEEKNNRK